MANNNPTSQESRERYQEFEKRINEMNLDDLNLTVALGLTRLDKDICKQCREKTNYPLFKLSILRDEDEFFPDYYLDCNFCSVACLKKFIEGLKDNLSDCDCELNKKNDN